MDKVYFEGTVISGISKYSELEFPDKTKIKEAPDDWPQHLVKGSLNICIDEDGYPEEFSNLGHQNDTSILDKTQFQPEFIIPGNLIKNNKLVPSQECHNRGNAQVWRATLTKKCSGDSTNCWVVRRFGSTIYRDLEIVSDIHLRNHFKLENGDRVIVLMFGQWDKT